ncbi:hypothetical protein SCHPADRAFT_891560 [Schizopora paradoxa]|uniref:DNA repair metallo-beta-lactamase domain-containing protein n=1 Tax=Schizopora paradoxa TaxID=27342 RepID=A0A0H2RI46_9AGAM|nr:hypothetical protein SCHPADRAFT_891560 [Schizopora paradoxa]
MPPGTPYNSFVQEYLIRVDEFTTPKSNAFVVPALHLLTHTHSDHIIGLNAKSFGSLIICSIDSKAMLLRHETFRSRALKENDFQPESTRTFSHLKGDYLAPSSTSDGVRSGSVDLLRALRLHEPTQFEISAEESVTITLLDANHCPGSVMFLIEGAKGAILHTGDVRAEPQFISALSRNPYVQRYIAPHQPFYPLKKGTHVSPLANLETIYLDTSCVLRTCQIPTKEDATSGLIELMRSYPESSRFFINAWTWGYEDVLKAVSRAFGQKIHVDRYKHDVYTSLTEDPFLKAIVTKERGKTRFHACERFSRCDEVKHDDPSVVYVNMVNIDCEKWKQYRDQTKAQIELGNFPTFLLVPLHRHSSLPELQALVSLFKPNRIVPNFLEPRLRGLDYACLPLMFGPYMAPGGAENIHADIRKENTTKIDSFTILDERELLEDVQLTNLECGGLEKDSALSTAAEKWGTDLEYDGGRLGGKIRAMRAFLSKNLASLVDGALKRSRNKILPSHLNYDEAEGEEDNDSGTDDGDSHGEIAGKIFPDYAMKDADDVDDSHQQSVKSEAIDQHCCETKPDPSTLKNGRNSRVADNTRRRKKPNPSTADMEVYKEEHPPDDAHAFALPRSPVLAAVDNVLKERSQSLSLSISRTCSVTTILNDDAQVTTGALSFSVNEKAVVSTWSKLASLKARPSLVLRLADEGQRSRDKSAAEGPSPYLYSVEHSRTSSSRREKREARISKAHPYAKRTSASKHSSSEETAPGNGTGTKTHAVSNSNSSTSIDWARIQSLQSSILQRLSRGEKPILPGVSFSA